MQGDVVSHPGQGACKGLEGAQVNSRLHNGGQTGGTRLGGV